MYQARLAGNKFTPNFKRANFWSPVITALGLFLHRVTDIASYIDDIYDCALLSWKYNFPIREVPGTGTASRKKAWWARTRNAAGKLQRTPPGAKIILDLVIYINTIDY